MKGMGRLNLELPKPRYVCACSVMSVTLWTIAPQAPLSMDFPGSGLPVPSPRDLLDPGLNPRLLHLLRWQADSLPLSHQEQSPIS